MPGDTLADRLRASRSAWFIGRAREVALIRSAIAAPELPFVLAWVSGPGGIGKSTLLAHLADVAQADGVVVVRLDGASLDPTPEAVAAAIDPPVARWRGRTVLVVDALDALGPVEDWLRIELLPSLPADTLVLVAARRPPGPVWRTDLGWGPALRAIPLADFDAEEAGEYLARRGVPAAAAPGALARTRGHPLALALLSDVIGQRPAEQAQQFDAAESALRDLVPTLLARFLDEVCDGVRRRALHVLGHARVTTVGLLREVLGPAEADACFDWMCTLSFVQIRGDGLAPHDLARDLLDRDLRWRDPQAWAAVHDSVQAEGTRRLLDGSGPGQGSAAADLIWLHRASPVLAPFAAWAEGASLGVEPANADDVAEILALVSAHEGPDSVAVHEWWWRTQPDAVHVVRSAGHRVHGFLVYPRLPLGEPAAVPADPVAVAAWRLLDGLAPLRSGEHLRIIRSWIGRDGYYRPTPTNQILTACVARLAVADVGLAATVGYAVDPVVWTPLYAYADYARAPDGDARVGQTAYAAFLHDWRVTRPPAWLDLLDERLRRSVQAAVTDDGEALAHAHRHLEPAGGPVLSEAQFAAAVKDAFRNAGDRRVLAHSPLMQARALRCRDAPGPPTAADLRDVLAAEVEALGQRPKFATAARALALTYLTAARTQEAAAARMSLPFSTYRRHLAAGMAEVARALWERELLGG